MGNEGKKRTSLLKDFATELYPGRGWGLLPPDEAEPRHRRAFTADTVKLEEKTKPLV